MGGEKIVDEGADLIEIELSGGMRSSARLSDDQIEWKGILPASDRFSVYQLMAASAKSFPYS